MRNLRIPMFVKFLFGCFTLAALLIIGGTFLFQEKKPASQGNFLAKHLRRYQGYEERVGRGMTGVLEVLASDTRLRRMVAARAGGNKEEAEVAGTAEALFNKLTSKNGIQPDFFVVFTTRNELVWASAGSPIKKEDLGDFAAAERARTGSTFAHQIVMIDSTLYQVSGQPIRVADDGEVVGGVVSGVQLDRYFSEYAEQSDDVPDRRIKPTVLRGQEVLASAFSEDQWSTIGKAFQLDKVATTEVNGQVREILRAGGIDYDFYAEDLEGYRGLEKATVGKVFLTRVRTAAEEGSKIPWVEIGIAFGLSIVIALGMAFWITRPIKQFVRQSSLLLQGDTDLTHRIVVNSRDETADLADNLNQVFIRLHGLATNVQSSAFQVGASSAQISAASKQMLSGIKDQSVKIESSTAAITELSASIQQVAENAAQATDAVEKSNAAATNAVSRMEQIREAVDDAAEKMRELGDSSKRIGNIVEVIRQISEQTSLLALNASIQAAQAGEHGRGFAVVADEVSSLARRVGQSAKDIEGLIQTIKEQTAAAVTSMETGTSEVDSGTQLVSATLADLGRLTSVVRDTARAVQEQAVVSDEIARNMDAVQEIAGEVLTGSEESVLQAERLHELAFRLEESIGGFNLDGNSTGPRPQPAHEPPPPRRVVAAAPAPKHLPPKSDRATMPSAPRSRNARG